MPGKITIFNPGSFPFDLSPYDYIEKDIPSMKRNPLILDTLFRCKDVEKAGTGFKRMSELCKENNVRWTYENVDIDKAMINGQTKKRKVCQYDLKGNKIKTWDSIHAASETLKIAHEKIAACCRYKQKTSGGFIWRYAYENINSIVNIDEYLKKRETNNHIKRNNKQTKRIAQYSLDNVFIREWDSSSEATEY